MRKAQVEACVRHKCIRAARIRVAGMHGGFFLYKGFVIVFFVFKWGFILGFFY